METFSEELFSALMELNGKEVVMVLTASQQNVPFMHILGNLKVTKSSLIEFVVGDAIVRAGTVQQIQIHGKREITFWIDNVVGQALMTGVHCSLRQVGL